MIMVIALILLSVDKKITQLGILEHVHPEWSSTSAVIVVMVISAVRMDPAAPTWHVWIALPRANVHMARFLVTLVVSLMKKHVV